MNPEFLTQAWTKFYECASTYNVVPAEAIKDKKLVSLHLCEAPGAFITSLNHYLKTNHQDLKVGSVIELTITALIYLSELKKKKFKFV